MKPTQRATDGRAAPGLELCVQSITTIGNIDRRRSKNANNHNNQAHDDATKSLIGIVTMQPNDLLGLQDDQITDAVDGWIQNVRIIINIIYRLKYF
jgi:hypothetical protein